MVFNQRFSMLAACLTVAATLCSDRVLAQQAVPVQTGPQMSAQSRPSQTPAAGSPATTGDVQSSSSGQKSATPPGQHEEIVLKKEQSQRLFGIIPMFSVTTRRDAPPLNPGQKFRLFARSSFDPFNIALNAADAGIGQATNHFPEYGQGAAGYGKRFGASFADSLSGNFFSDFAYPTLFREDPRYFRLGEGGFSHRAGYALTREFVCRTDRGKRSFNWAKVLGAFSAGALSNTYYPNREREVGKTLSRSAFSLLYGSANGLLSEFWPDVQRKMFHKH